jgi:hypothetical protein
MIAPGAPLAAHRVGGGFRMLSFLVALGVTAGTPYPMPQKIQDEPGLKFASGTLQSVDTSGTRIVITSGAGPLTLNVAQAAIYDEDRRDRLLRSVCVGRTLDVWYVIANGAIAKEVDLAPPTTPPLVALPDDSLKLATGQIASLSPDLKRLIVTTPAGPVTFLMEKTAVRGLDHHAKSIVKLPPGTWVTVTYVVQEGARARQIDVKPTPAPKPVG